MLDRRHDIEIGIHSAFGLSIGSGSGGRLSGFGGSLRAVGDNGVREVVGTGGSVAGMFSLGGFDDDCRRRYRSRIASACLSGCIFGVGRFRRDRF